MAEGSCWARRRKRWLSPITIAPSAAQTELVKEYATEEEESPEVVCVTCLITGHQGGKECHLPKDECENCGRSHNWMLTCMEVRLYLKHGGDPMSHARPVLNEKTLMGDICPNCLDLLHHSCRPCQKKESPSGSDRVAPLSPNNSKKESPREPYRDALKKGTFQIQETGNTPDDSPQLVVLMPKGKTLAKETLSPAGGRSNPTRSLKGTWMKRGRSYVYGIIKEEPPRSDKVAAERGQ